jgi:hypothetical protein
MALVSLTVGIGTGVRPPEVDAHPALAIAMDNTAARTFFIVSLLAPRASDLALEIHSEAKPEEYFVEA